MIYNSTYKIEKMYSAEVSLKRCYNELSPKWQALHKYQQISFLFMVAHYTFKYILKYAVNYLIMIDRIVDKKYIRSTDETMCLFFKVIFSQI